MTRPVVPLPSPLRAFRVVAVVRVVVAASSLAAAAVVVPRTFDRASQRLVGGRLDDPTVPRLDLSGLAPVVTVFAVVFGAVFLGGWVFCAWRVPTGRRWAAITTGVVSGYAVVSGLLSILVLALERLLPRPLLPGLPWWYLALAGLAVVVDLVVVVLLVLPTTRAWYRAVNPPAVPAPGYGPPGYPPPGHPPPAYGPFGPGRRH